MSEIDILLDTTKVVDTNHPNVVHPRAKSTYPNLSYHHLKPKYLSTRTTQVAATIYLSISPVHCIRPD